MAIPGGLVRRRGFEHHASKRPNAVAIASGEERLTYAELNAKAETLADALADAGLGPESIVAVLLNHSPEHVAALLAVLKAGGTFLPIDPALPSARIEFMLADAAPAAVICERGAAPRLPALPAPIVEVPCGPIRAKAPRVPPRPVTPHSLAYAIYTSGSTGVPKAALIEHGGLANLILHTMEPLGLSAKQPLPAVRLGELRRQHLGDLSHSLRGRNTAYPSVGASSSRDRSGARDPAIGNHSRPSSSFPGGDVESGIGAGIGNGHRRWRSMRRRIGGANGRRTASSSMHMGRDRGDGLHHAHAMHGRGVAGAHVGRPISERDRRVLNDDLEEVPAGEIGELVIGGPGVARGYLNRPELTAERFRTMPLGVAARAAGLPHRRHGSLCGRRGARISRTAR